MAEDEGRDPLATADIAHLRAEAERQKHRDQPQPGRQFKPVRFEDITMSSDPPYLVQGLLPRDGLAVLWGPPKCGKSFWAFDVALHVALGREYRDRAVQQGTVVYIACEGERGLGARTEAFRQAKLGEDDDHNPPFWLLTTRLNLSGDIETLIADLKAAGITEIALSVIDTLNRSIAGSESKDEDMGAYVQAADRLREAFGGLCMVIHHCGVNGERPRGHSSLTGAVDAQLKAERSTSGKVMVDVEFLKDGGSEGERIVSVLTPVTVGEASDGSDITSCIIEASDGDGDAAPKQKRPHLTPLAKIALKALNKAIGEAGSEAPASNHIPSGRRVAGLDLWRRYYYLALPKDDTLEARKKSFQRAREILQAAEVIGLHDDLCWII